MKQDLVSIIIPIYNVAAYLDRCVASACAQTYPHLQILLVDDGSRDACPEMCDAWAEKDSRIQVIHKKNGGLSDARNAGLDAAKGAYIYFLDGDDYIEPTLVETALGHMEADVDMVVFQYLAHRDGGETYQSPYQIGRYPLPDGQSRAEFTLDVLLQYRIGWDAWSRMYKREKIERYGLRFADNREIFAEDLYFCLCYCAHARQVVCIPDVLYHYILREGSIMSRNQKNLNVGRMSALAKHVMGFYEKSGDCQALLQVFPQIHYYIIINVLEPARRKGLVSGRTGREKILAELPDPDFFKKQIRAVLKNPRLLQPHDRGRCLADKLSYLRYIADGFYPGLQLRSRYINRAPEKLDEKLGIGAIQKEQADRLAKTAFDIYVIGTEDFGNVGDHQIARAMLAFLKAHCPEKTVAEVTASMYPAFREALKKSIPRDALIVMPGGGNFGDIYPLAQDIRQDVMDTWPENRKIVFPQTIRFSHSEKGREYLKRAKETYTKERNVTLVAREETSFRFAKENFDCRCLLMPDIVLWQSQQKDIARKGTALLVLRRDEEKASGVDVQAISALQGRRLQWLDHQLNYSVALERREQTVEWVLEQYRKASLVITDRLHGMVFAAVTGTPCLAVASYDHKIPGTYQWIRHLPYVRYVETAEAAERAAEELLRLEGCRYDGAPLTGDYEELARMVREYAEN